MQCFYIQYFFMFLHQTTKNNIQTGRNVSCRLPTDKLTFLLKELGNILDLVKISRYYGSVKSESASENGNYAIRFSI